MAPKSVLANMWWNSLILVNVKSFVLQELDWTLHCSSSFWKQEMAPGLRKGWLRGDVCPQLPLQIPKEESSRLEVLVARQPYWKQPRFWALFLAKGRRVTGCFLGRWKECVNINQKIHWAPCLGHRRTTASSNTNKSCQIQERRRKESCPKGVGAQWPARRKGNPSLCWRKLRALTGYGELQEPTRAGAATLPRGPAPPEGSSGEDLSGPEEAEHSPRWSWRRTGSHRLISAVLGRDGRPIYSPGKPRAKGQWMNELPTRPSLPGHGQTAEGSPAGMLEGFSESAPRQGFQSWKTSASSSSSCGFTTQHPIFGLWRARAGSGTPTAQQRRTSRESAGTPVRPGRRLRAGAGGPSARKGPAAGSWSGGRAAEMRRALSRGGAGAPRRCGQVIDSPRGRRQGGPHPGYWPPADPPRRCGRLRSPSPAPRLGLFAQRRPI